MAAFSVKVWFTFTDVRLGFWVRVRVRAWAMARYRSTTIIMV
jgi:hypothetical protein